MTAQVDAVDEQDAPDGDPKDTMVWSTADEIDEVGSKAAMQRGQQNVVFVLCKSELSQVYGCG